jgi:meso-butanediol dehydrogenase/(S,S)-butanediol dehydrogenase/diacetyl reductase
MRQSHVSLEEADHMRFENKTVIVTGGASGQGAATCRLFAAEGADVIIADWNADAAHALADEIGARAIATDVSREADIIAMVEFAAGRSDRVDVLVNNAGIGYSARGRYPMASVVDTPEDAWDAIIAINLKGVAMGCKHVIPLMARNGGGAIVNIASINALVAMPGADAYTAAKGGIVALTRVLAIDWAASNIRVNCICPGAVDTPMIAGIASGGAADEALLNTIPQRRLGRPEEIAHMTLALSAPESSYVTGVILPVDGGVTAR